MTRCLLIIILILRHFSVAGQPASLRSLLADPALAQASLSLSIIDATTGEALLEHDAGKNLIPGSVLKLFTTAAAFGLLGPQHTFHTDLGYSGAISAKDGKLNGNLIIRGGGDPSFGSKNFPGHYGDFIKGWINDLKNQGIKSIGGNIVIDDSYFDYQPVPPGWLWEDIGNYFGAGAFGLSVFDNTYELHFKTSSDSSGVTIKSILPAAAGIKLDNRLYAAGNTDKGYIFATPYTSYGWVTGSIPVNRDDFVLKGAITDPPLTLSKILYSSLDSAGITVSGMPTTTRLSGENDNKDFHFISRISSPTLAEIIKVLNRESINLYAEHLIKEIGKEIACEGTTVAGKKAILKFLDDSGIPSGGIFIEDGSGLSPLNSVSTGKITSLLFYMKNSSPYFQEFYFSLPGAGREGTLKNNFMDQVFISNLRAKSGSLRRVRSYAGYFTARSGREMTFCIIVNNFSGSSQVIIEGIERILKEIILNN